MSHDVDRNEVNCYLPKKKEAKPAYVLSQRVKAISIESFMTTTVYSVINSMKIKGARGESWSCHAFSAAVYPEPRISFPRICARRFFLHMAPPTVALVTGANRGIGRAVAESLAAKYHYHVIIGSRDAADGQAVADNLLARGLLASAVQLDITSDTSITAAVQHIEHVHGKLDVLVNNAAVFVFDEPSGPGADELKALREVYSLTLNTNVAATAVLTEALLPLLHKADRPGPRVVFVGSEAGSVGRTRAGARLDPGDVPGDGDAVRNKAYRASKAAVNMLAVAYARELRNVGGRVNAVCPGFTATRMTAPAGAEVLAAHAGTPELGAQRIVEMATLGEERQVTATFSDRHGEIAW